ncbi:MAG: hypothetical protein ACP5JR_03840 [Thermoplasmata archaeon]
MKIFKITENAHILGIVKGLVSESRSVEDYFREFKPEVVGIGISGEELEGLKTYIKSGFELPPLSNIEEIYAEKLAVFGDVGFPPPAFETCVSYCLLNEIKLHALDIPENEFTDIYCKNVHTGDLIRQSFRVKRLRKKKFKAETPEEFEIQWDAAVNKIAGFRMVENARERHMAEKLVEILSQFRMLAVIEIARAENVFKILFKKPIKDER